MSVRHRVAMWMALVYGLGLAAFETLVNWGQWQWWPWFVVDYVAAGLLLAGAYASFAGQVPARPLLAAGWGFALGMMWMSLAGNIEQGPDPARAGRVADLYIQLIASSMIYCLIGILLSLSGRETQSNV